MKVLVLSPYPNLLRGPIEAGGDTFISHMPDMEVSDLPPHDWLVSFGYRKIIPKERIASNQINIHMSLLPFNRGADPNFWSWFDDTPKGVTIHRMSAELDAGEILAQIKVPHSIFRQPATLATTYNDLAAAAAGLFARSWPGIKSGDIPRPSPFIGAVPSYHAVDDRRRLEYLFPLGNNTQVKDVQHLGDLYHGKTSHSRYHRAG